MCRLLWRIFCPQVSDQLDELDMFVFPAYGLCNSCREPCCQGHPAARYIRGWVLEIGGRHGLRNPFTMVCRPSCQVRPAAIKYENHIHGIYLCFVVHSAEK